MFSNIILGEFFMNMNTNKIYLDQASTSFPKAPSVAKAVYDYLSGSAVNVNRGGYRAAYSVEEQIFETREQLLRLFHFSSGKGKNVIFTGNITTSLNVLLKGLLKPGDHVLVTAMEHNAVMRPLVQLTKNGVSFDRIPCDSEGNLHPACCLSSRFQCVRNHHASAGDWKLLSGTRAFIYPRYRPDGRNHRH